MSRHTSPVRLWLHGLLVLAIVAVGLAASVAAAAEKKPSTENTKSTKPLKSGRQVGEYVPTFYCRVVTGPLMNKSVCYVCRNGSRPVVMVLVRKVTPELKPLLKSLDRIVDENRAIGLKSFGVLLSDDPVRDASSLQTFAFDNKISIPLTIANNTVADSSGMKVHSDAAVTVLLYRNRRVVSNFSYRDGELKSSQIQTVLKRVRRFAMENE